jgi:hypothetical protein
MAVPALACQSGRRVYGSGGGVGQALQGVKKALFHGRPGVGALDVGAAGLAEALGEGGVGEQALEDFLEVGIVAEPETAAAGGALPAQDGAFGVDEAGGAGQPGFQKDDAEAFVEGGMDEGEGAGHGVVLFLFRDEAEIENGGGEVGRRFDRAAAGEDEAEIVAGAFAEGVQVVEQQGGAFEGFAAAGVEDVGGVDAMAAAEAVRVGGERVEAHTDDGGVCGGDLVEAFGQVLFGFGVKQQAGDGVEEGVHDAQVGEGFVVQAGDEQGFVGMELGGVVDQAEEVGAHHQDVVGVAVLGEVVVQRAAVDVVLHPGGFRGVVDFAAAADAGLGGQEGGQVAVFIDREVVDGEALDGAGAGRDFVGPGEVVTGAGGQDGDLMAGRGGAEGEIFEQGFGAADGGLFREARRQEGDALGCGHVRVSDFPVRPAVFPVPRFWCGIFYRGYRWPSPAGR